MNITEEKTAVKSRLAEIENEMSTAHRDHAFEYWWQTSESYKKHSGWKASYQKAWNACHSIYCHEAKIKIERPPVSAMYALFAIGVVVGMIISFVTFLFVIQPN